MKRILSAFLLLGAGHALAGMYDAPYALIQSAPRQPAHGVEPARVMRIDDERALGRGLPVAPGKHVVEVSLPGPHGVSGSTRRTIEIEAKACTRYFIGGRRPARSSRDWEVFVEREEAIGECRAKLLAV